MPRELTLKQKAVLEFIRERIQSDLPPTIREIAREMGFSSTGTVRDYLRALESKGYLKRQDSLARSIALTKVKAAGIPILGDIPAGRPNLAYEDIQGYVDTGDLFLGRLGLDDVFALRVRGDSMIDAGILDGDIAMIRKQRVADSGDIVAALLEANEVTLKRLKYQKKRFFLEAANNNYPPISEKFTIIGKLMTIIRKY